MKHLPQIKKRIATLREMPMLGRHLVVYLNDPNVDFSVLSEQMRYDPGMTANVLRLANSAHFGLARRVSSLKEAFVRLGMTRLFQLVVAGGMAPLLKKPLPGYDLRREELLRHSIWVAVASEELCKKLRLRIPETVFTAGMLIDIGRNVLDEFVLKERRNIEMAVEEDNISYEEAERRILGIDHPNAGADVVDHWKFPEELVAAIRWHREPEKAERHAMLAGIVHLADVLAMTSGIGVGNRKVMYRPPEEVMKWLKIRSRTIEYVASQTLDKMHELEKMLE
ncbi:MAG: HDOD domain-containing protein [Kiritimatiellae bacterium]|nr:HDOD domain-containing protein [Kiritimatiellia bacterium]